MDAFQETTMTPTHTDKFQQLIKDIIKILGPSSGIDSDDVDEHELIALMETYGSNEKEWEQYAHRDGSRTYTRNLVDKGNGKSNLVSQQVHNISVYHQTD